MNFYRHQRAGLCAFVIMSIMAICGPLHAQHEAAVVSAECHRRAGYRRQWTRSRRLGDRGDHRSADQICQMVVTNDAGQFVIPAAAGRQVQDLGARLRAGRFRQAGRHSRKDHRAEGKGCADGRCRRGILSGHVLVLDAQDTRRQRISGLGQKSEPACRPAWIRKPPGSTASRIPASRATRSAARTFAHPT